MDAAINKLLESPKFSYVEEMESWMHKNRGRKYVPIPREGGDERGKEKELSEREKGG